MIAAIALGAAVVAALGFVALLLAQAEERGREQEALKQLRADAKLKERYDEIARQPHDDDTTADRLDRGTF